MGNYSSELPAQCGISVISDLVDCPASQQLEKLKDVMGTKASPRKAMVLLSDVTSREKTVWAATKKIATRTKAMINPNSDNEIRLYMVRPDDLEDLEAIIKTSKK